MSYQHINTQLSTDLSTFLKEFSTRKYYEFSAQIRLFLTYRQYL